MLDISQLRDYALVGGAVLVTIFSVIRGTREGKSTSFKAANEEFEFLKKTVESQAERITGLETHVAKLQGQLDHKDEVLQATQKERDELKAQASLQAISPALQEFVTSVAGKNYEMGLQNRQAIDALTLEVSKLTSLIQSFTESQKSFISEMRKRMPEVNRRA